MYKQDVTGFDNSGQWGYNTDEFGTRVINPTVEKTYQLNTNWLTYEMNVYYQELITSPQVYIKINGKYYACIVQENGFEVTRQKNKNLIKVLFATWLFPTQIAALFQIDTWFPDRSTASPEGWLGDSRHSARKSELF